jgi:hypothetical protein
MKVSRKKINNILIYYGGTVILIFIFFYCFYKKYENFYGAPKGKGVKVGYGIPVYVDPTKMATKNKLSNPNQVAVCLNGQYTDATQANGALVQQARVVKQKGLDNTNQKSVSVNNITDEFFKEYISLYFTEQELFDSFKNTIIHLSDTKQNIIWEKIVPNWPKDNTFNDKNFEEYIRNFDNSFNLINMKFTYFDFDTF